MCVHVNSLMCACLEMLGLVRQGMTDQRGAVTCSGLRCNIDRH